MNPLDKPLMQLARTIITLKPVLIDAIGVEALNFVDENFVKQGFQGETFQPWAPLKKQPKRGRKILQGTLHLRHSINKTDASDHTTIHTDDVKAKIHNEGGDIHMPGRTALINFRRTSAKKGGRLLFTGRKYKTVAQAKVSIGAYTIHMPQRQFIPTQASPSPILNRRCEKVILKILIANLSP